MSIYVGEDFTPAEADVLRRYFTNLDQPVFALVNLPEVVKGALFARYSRSAKSLRRLFLDEFVPDLDVRGDVTIDATMGLKRAEDLYDKVFLEYGDDSVAQLGGVHLACEQASNLLTKVLEWGRLMAYLEQSTRYIPYDSRPGGRYRYFRDPAVMNSAQATTYIVGMDGMFETYSRLLPVLTEHIKAVHPKSAADSDFVYRQAIRAKAFDALRGLLPAASLSNVGIYGTGQGYEMMLLRMRSHPLPEVQLYADMMLTELRKVIPSFLKRVDLPERGQVWSEYLASTSHNVADIAHQLFQTQPLEADDDTAVQLVDFDPDGERNVVAAALYPHSSCSEGELLRRVDCMSVDERTAVLTAEVGDRTNRRHRPGRAFERTSYRWDILSDYGAFRDLQRHRMLTITWQRLTPNHGFTRPDLVDEAGAANDFNASMESSAELYEALNDRFPQQASYAVALAYRVRYNMHMNAREAMHVLELRTAPAGHPAYRRVCQEMHRQISEVAGHHAIAAAMKFVDHSHVELERLDAERRAESRRGAQ